MKTAGSDTPGNAITKINMKIAFLILSILFTGAEITGQAVSGAVEIVTIYSQNEKFYLKSIPFAGEAPTLRGRTYVYERRNVFRCVVSLPRLVEWYEGNLERLGEKLDKIICVEAQEEVAP